MDYYYWWLESADEDYEFHEQKAGPKRAICPGCRDVLDDWYPRPVEAVLSGVKRAVSVHCRVPVVHADVWKQIESHAKAAIIGPVKVRSGDIDRHTLDWVTVLFPPEQSIHVRGSPMRGMDGHPCLRCGRSQYFAGHDPHLLRRDIPPGCSVFMSRVNRLIIAEPLAESLDWSTFPDLVYDRLPVLERPLDGVRLLGDPDWSATP